MGIDEAGYGPLLGPLVNAASIWEVAAGAAEDAWWDQLDDCVTRAPHANEWRLHIDDSKRVYKRAVGLGTLERGVLAFCGLNGGGPTCSASFLQAVAGGGEPIGSRLPWYAGRPRTLPLDAKRAASAALVAKLRQRLAAAGIRFVAAHSWPLAEDRYNDRLARTNNKATVLLERVLQLAEHGRAAAGDQDVLVRVDHLGGRVRYHDLLRLAYPERELTIVRETAGRSTYRLDGPTNTLTFDFVVDGDQASLPIALASMFAKYTRELIMLDFNAFWRQWEPDLRPTAGYYRDAQRFLDDITPLIPQSGLERPCFVRGR